MNHPKSIKPYQREIEAVRSFTSKISLILVAEMRFYWSG